MSYYSGIKANCSVTIIKQKICSITEDQSFVQLYNSLNDDWGGAVGVEMSVSEQTNLVTMT